MKCSILFFEAFLFNKRTFYNLTDPELECALQNVCEGVTSDLKRDTNDKNLVLGGLCHIMQKKKKYFHKVIKHDTVIW